MPEVLFLIKSLSWPERRNEGARERELWLTVWAPGKFRVFRENFDLLDDDSDLMVSSPHSITATYRAKETDGCGNSLLWSVVWVFFFFLRNGYCEINQSLIAFCFSTLVSVAFLHFHMLVAVVFVSNEYMIFTTLNWLHLNFLIGDCSVWTDHWNWLHDCIWKSAGTFFFNWHVKQPATVSFYFMYCSGM